ncbi:hypothetical protein MMC16_006592 [Acarospora aff. strigata]|nr:hypothetical protein [Acarospora aff. strigata]
MEVLMAHDPTHTPDYKHHGIPAGLLRAEMEYSEYDRTFWDNVDDNNPEDIGVSDRDRLSHKDWTPRSPSTLRLEDLPNELLGHIISLLDTEAPSIRKLTEEPSLDLTVSETRHLKNISLTSRHFRQLSIPRLFRCCRVKTVCYRFYAVNAPVSVSFFVDEMHSCLGFLRSNGLLGYVQSLVVYIDGTPSGTLRGWSMSRETQRVWQHILPHINPQSLTIIGAPFCVARSISCDLSTQDAWAFDMPLHIVRLEQDPTITWTPAPGPDTAPGHLLSAKPWTHLSLNEGSSLAAYRSYEYYLKTPPSILSTRPHNHISSSLLALSTTLKSLHFTCSFPFYSHTDDMLKYARLLPLLERLSVQLIPSLDSSVFADPERTARVNLEDCWLEVDTGYSLVVHAVVEMGRKGCLRVFESRDWDVADMGVSLEAKVSEMAGGRWRGWGEGVWRRQEEGR